MVFKYVRKQVKESPLKTTLFILLLVVAGLLLALSAGLFLSTSKTVANTTELYTTIAVPDYSAIRAYAEKNPITETETNPSIDLSFGIRLKEFEVRSNIMDMTFSESFIDSDTRGYFSAYSPDILAVTSGLRDKVRYSAALDSPHYISAFVVECTGVETMGSSLSSYSLVKANVEEIVKMYSEYPAPKTIQIRTSVFNADGSPVFEEGKHYLVIGAYQPQILAEGDAHERLFALTEPMLALTYELVLDPESGVVSNVQSVDYNSPYFYYTWFELDGSLDDALDGAHGDEIRAALDIAEKSINSVRILTTDKLASILQFNRGDAQMIEGREFSDSEIESGAKVCIIPQGIAEYNNLSVGDVIPLALYQSEFTETSYNGVSRWEMRAYVPYAAELPMEEYAIVGIYQAEEWEEGIYALATNTVFIPNNAFSGFNVASSGAVITDIGGTPPITYSCIIETGRIEDFKAAVEKQYPGYSEFFLFFDQEYSAASGALENLSKSATIIFIICAAVWVVVLVLFLLLLIGSKKNQLGMLSAIGIGKKFRFRSLFLLCTIIILVAGIISCTLGMVFYEKVIDESYSTAYESTGEDSAAGDEGGEPAQGSVMQKNILVIPLIVALQMVVILLASGAYIHRLLKRSTVDLLRT